MQDLNNPLLMNTLFKYKELLRQSIAKKFIIYIFIFSAAITVILTMIQLYMDYQKGINTIQNNISVVEASHLDTIINTLWVSDMELLQIQLNGMLKLSDMQYIAITDGDEVIAEAGSAQSEHILSRTFPLYHEYGAKSMSLGTLEVTFTLTKLYKRLLTDAVVIAITHAIKTLLLSLFIFIIFYQLVGRHLVVMSDYATSLKFNHLDSPLILNRSKNSQNSADELTTVVDAINLMRQNLIRDVADVIQVKNKLRKSEELLQFAISAASLGIWDRNLKTNKTYFNSTYWTMLGYEPEELIHSHRTWEELIHPDDRKMVEHEVQKGLAHDKAWKIEYRLRAKNNTYKWILSCGKAVEKDEAGKPLRATGVHIDISEGRNLQKERQKVIKLESVGILAGGIAHDFNNLLSAILGNIELASYHVENDKNAASLLADAQKATKRAAKLTQQLLTFSKGGEPLKEKTSLIKLIRESADFALHGSRISCEYSLQDNLWMVKADAGQVGQVIQNITINAQQAMPDGGKIFISAYNVEDASIEPFLNTHYTNFICIKLQDFGTGIPQEIIDKIFDPYFTTKQHGSGLGLAICHSIIKKHDGHIAVQSIPDEGTTFTIFLPAVTSIDSTVNKKANVPSTVKAAKIMVMDDDQMIRNVAKAQLLALGHEPVLVADGAQAIKKYQELQATDRPVDLVIMDLTIPGGMGGQEASIKLLEIFPEAKIVVSSGYSTDPIIANYREYGFCAAVAKPFDLAALSKAIETVLN